MTFGGALRPSSSYTLRPEECRLVAETIADRLSLHRTTKGYFETRLNGNIYVVSFIARRDDEKGPTAELPFCKITPLYFNQIVVFDRRVIEKYMNMPEATGCCRGEETILTK